jgi:hypothetical protein
MARCYGNYSNASRGLGQRKNLDDLTPSILESKDLKSNRTWARLIQRIHELGPLDLPEMSGEDENHQFYREQRGDQEDPQASWPLGFKRQIPVQDQGVLRKDFYR